jgi:phage-related minor tail protein
LNLGEVIAAANGPRRAPLDIGDPARLSDQDLAHLQAELAAQVVNITRQLDDDREMNCSRGDAWRRRAMGARRVHLASIDKLVVEGRRRRLGFAGDVPPVAPVGLNGAPLPPAEVYAINERKRQAREHQAAVEAEAARRKSEYVERKALAAQAEIAAKIELARVKAENHARFLAEKETKAALREEIKQATARRQEQCFIDAAHDLLGTEAWREIWARAREMHPDPAIWSKQPTE